MIGGILGGLTKQFMSKALSPQRTYNWDIFLPDIQGAMGALVGLCCQEISFADFVINNETVRYGGFSSKFPSLQDINTFQMTFIKPSPDIVSSYFYTWKELNIDSKGYYHVKSDYAKTMKVYFYDTTGIPMYTVELVNVYPLSVMSYNLSYSSESVVMISINMSVDRVGVEGFSPNEFEYISDEEMQSITSTQKGISVNTSGAGSGLINLIANSISTNARYIPSISQITNSIGGVYNPLITAAIDVGFGLAKDLAGKVISNKPNVSVTPPAAKEISTDLSTQYFKAGSLSATETALSQGKSELSLLPKPNTELASFNGGQTAVAQAVVANVQPQYVNVTFDPPAL